MTTLSKDIEQLNTFLRGERSAVETYKQCLNKVSDPTVTAHLLGMQESHRQRVELLALKIRALGGSPSSGSGVWGSFVRLIVGGTSMLGETVAISTLEAGEDYGVATYQHKVTSLSPMLRRFIEIEVMPEQQRSHELLVKIERTHGTTA